MKSKSEIIKTLKIEIKGLVQGVGFRPFVYRIAKKHSVNGWVENRNDGVGIVVSGEDKAVKLFIEEIKTNGPPASYIDSLEIEEIEIKHFNEFKIVKSRSMSNQITDICPDIAVCNDCLSDMKVQKNRINYPFINCTNCGPRFTIIKDLPYDREKTTMSSFEMCDDCHNEYIDIENRRFHAQPVACAKCGPEYTLWTGTNEVRDIDRIINKLVSMIHAGKIIAIKGLGGYFISCDALNEDAVKRLRKLKNREGKPFAVMFRDIETVKRYTFVGKEHEVSLRSWRKPIVLLSEKIKLAPSVNVGFNTIGVMLPYMPLHYLLFEKLQTPAIVLTSGNISDEPIVIDNDIALKKLSVISDAVLIYNREIYNRTDDSVVTVINKKERIIRRSRGYVPSPVNLKMNVDGILATGAELVNCFCIGKGNQAIMSQHIGDLKNIETYEFYCETISQFEKLFRFKPEYVACDLHSDYLSSMYAEKTGLKQIKIQHHHAHIASCIAEQQIDGKVIGISFDGTGLGDDGNIWGGEFFICDLKEYKRISHFEYIPAPGGDKVTSEPWRMAVSYLHRYFKDDFINFNLPFLKNIDKYKLEILITAIDKKINSPLSSSAGRLFDAVAAMINLCPQSSSKLKPP